MNCPVNDTAETLKQCLRQLENKRFRNQLGRMLDGMLIEVNVLFSCEYF